MSWLGGKKDKKGLGLAKPQAMPAVQPIQVQEPKEQLKVVPPPPPKKDEGREIRLYEVKKRIHHLLLERLDLSALEELDEQVRARRSGKPWGSSCRRRKSP